MAARARCKRTSMSYIATTCYLRLPGLPSAPANSGRKRGGEEELARESGMAAKEAMGKLRANPPWPTGELVWGWPR
jgi:hypothetical protein